MDDFMNAIGENEMTETNEFKEALELLKNNMLRYETPYDGWNGGDVNPVPDNVHSSIRKALLLADRLLMEPSDGMKQAFKDECEANMTNWGIKLKGFDDGIKAMVAQLIKEIETEIKDGK